MKNGLLFGIFKIGTNLVSRFLLASVEDKDSTIDCEQNEVESEFDYVELLWVC